MQVITIAAALFAAIPFASAGNPSGGRAIVINQCDFDVYLWSIDADRVSSKPTTCITKSGGTYEERYRVPSTGGVSMKLAKADHLGPDVHITQFEYTLAGNIWYDISNVDCTTVACPFQSYGMTMRAGSGCPVVRCHAGDMTCREAYTEWNDDWASKACDATSDVVMTLCSEQPAPEKRGYGARVGRVKHIGHPHIRPS
ncbi:hypothetical protein M501DRAFT_277294 [Patellaria atrata CBS 101060]|uniref:Uncharacterized protein n=1 Tax=Patellaria atrata CBS 101060 TaxID=1346257 RepID=A0A9P4S6J9_9PEZI|nr:hypothetical protein M501DRAFT_277294 [Patellaria atrata CBS 101060]